MRSLFLFLYFLLFGLHTAEIEKATKVLRFLGRGSLSGGLLLLLLLGLSTHSHISKHVSLGGLLLSGRLSRGGTVHKIERGSSGLLSLSLGLSKLLLGLELRLLLRLSLGNIHSSKHILLLRCRCLSLLGCGTTEGHVAKHICMSSWLRSRLGWCLIHEPKAARLLRSRSLSAGRHGSKQIK